jgi:hypothetical protein
MRTANPFEIAKYRANPLVLQYAVQPATDDFFAVVAAWNAYRSAEKIRADLAGGEALYTNLYYRRADLGALSAREG